MTTGPDTESGNGLWTISSSGASSITHLCIANYRLQGDYQHNNLFYNYLLSPNTKCALHVHTLQNCRYLDIFSVFIHLLCSTIKTKYNVHVCVVSEKHNFNINTEQLNIGHLRTTRLFREVVISLLGKGPFPYYVSIFIDLHRVEQKTFYAVQVYKNAYIIWEWPLILIQV